MTGTGLVEELRCTAKILRPFARQAPPSSAIFDASALYWWTFLTTVADILQAQEDPPTTAQQQYVDRMLFGGMGSLHDFALNATVLGERARKANDELKEARRRLYGELHGAG